VTRIRPEWIMRFCAALAILAHWAPWPAAAQAEGDAMLATLDKPATVTVQRASVAGETASPRRPRVIISVTNYSPTADCTPVQVVVKGRVDDRPEVEVGRFAITPDRGFDAAAPEAQRFALPLPSGLGTDKPVRFSVHLVLAEGAKPNSACPTGGPRAAKPGGASVRIGEVEIQ